MKREAIHPDQTDVALPDEQFILSATLLNKYVFSTIYKILFIFIIERQAQDIHSA